MEIAIKTYGHASMARRSLEANSSRSDIPTTPKKLLRRRVILAQSPPSRAVTDAPSAALECEDDCSPELDVNVADPPYDRNVKATKVIIAASNRRNRKPFILSFSLHRLPRLEIRRCPNFSQKPTKRE